VKASQIVEAVLFASDAPLKAEEIARADESLDEDRVEEAIQDLTVFYDETERGFQILEVAEGYQILTRPEFSSYLERFDTVPRPSRLSGPALETLAIIAYRQPIGRVEVEYIRGVGSSGVIRSLQDRALVEVVGRAEGLGRPLLYGTTGRFLEHFGFASLDDLPRPEELPVVLRDRIPLGLDDDEEGEDPDQLSLGGSEEPTDDEGGGTGDQVASGENGAGDSGDGTSAVTGPDPDELSGPGPVETVPAIAEATPPSAESESPEGDEEEFRSPEA